MGDFNEFILIPKSRLFFSKLGNRKLITDKHGTEGPRTTRTNWKNKAIDRIWVSPGLSKTSCGYLPVNQVLKSDHRLIWVKLTLSNTLGNKTLPSITPSERKLRLHHPDGQKKYTSKLRHITRQYNILPRLRVLEKIQISPQPS